MTRRYWLSLVLAFALPALLRAGDEPQANPPAPSSVAPPPAAVALPAPALPPEEQGDVLMAQKRYQAAIEAYKKGNADSAKIWNKMGIAYQMLFSYENAQRCYQRSLKLDPKNSHVLNNLGTVFDSRRNLGAAEKMYRKALKVAPQSPLILKNLGTNLLAQHKYKKAWEAYNAALAIDPRVFEHANASPRAENPSTAQDRGAMNYFMAKNSARAGKLNEAIDYLRLALNQGFTTPKKILEDKEFGLLRGIPTFEQLLSAQKIP